MLWSISFIESGDEAFPINSALYTQSMSFIESGDEAFPINSALTVSLLWVLSDIPL